MSFFRLSLCQAAVLIVAFPIPLISQTPPTISAGALDQRRVQLEDTLKTQRPNGKTDDDVELRKTAAELAEVAGQEDDLRQELPPAAKASANNTKLNIPVFFVTNRQG